MDSNLPVVSKSPEFSHRTRTAMLEELTATPGGSQVFDALIVGGGIVGAGLARELSIRGVSTLLVEKGDFASGTSSRSSKLIHGGLRYLEMLDFGLVFESLSERHWLLKTHPHLVQPLEFNLPLYRKDNCPPGARASAALGLALWLYDGLSLFRTPFFHGKRKVEALKKLFPSIREQGLKGGYYYADAMMLDDELVLETIYDAYRRGAKPLNYVSAVNVGSKNKDGIYTVFCKDELSGKTFQARAKEVIACVGPWTEAFGEHVVGGAERQLKPSKGVHLILPWKRLPIDECLVMYAPDGRIVFAIPRKDLGTGAEVVILGTTDSAEHGDLDHITSNKNDVEYLLKVMQEYFPKAGITKSDIVMTYAGVRPLLDSGEESEAKTSREHEIWRNKEGVVFMAGGKYTTFRKISQEIADFTYPKTHSKKFDKESKTLISTPLDYVARLQGKPLWGKFTEGWIEWKLAHHSPCTLEDLVFRRMPLWMGGVDAAKAPLHVIAGIASRYFGWDTAEQTRQIASVEKELARQVECLN